MAFINQAYQRADAFLFGRRTYELLTARCGGPAGKSRAWEPVRAGAEHPAQVRGLDHPRRSGRGRAPPSCPTTSRAPSADLKATPGGELQVHGKNSLIRWLLEHDLVDEMTLIVVPVVLGQGARLFPDAGPDVALTWSNPRVDTKGVTIQVYRPAGRPQYASWS